jgi:hypothetical protein
MGCSEPARQTTRGEAGGYRPEPSVVDEGGAVLVAPGALDPSGVGTACGVAGSEVGSVVGAGSGGVVALGDSAPGEVAESGAEVLFGAGLLQALASSASAQTIGSANRWVMSFSARGDGNDQCRAPRRGPR